MPPGLEPSIFAALVAASGATSFITAAFGIGGGGLLLAIMATLVPPAALIPVHGVVQAGSNLGRLALFLRWLHRPALPGFALGTLAGCALGGLVAVELPPAAVQIGVGAFVIWTVFARPPRWLNGAPALTGAISSVLTMFFGATGLFVASYTKSFDLPRLEHVATHAGLMTLQHGVKVVVFGLLGFAFAEWGVLILAMIAAGGLGTLLGRSLLLQIDDKRFRLVLDTLLVLIAAQLVWSGLAALVRPSA